MASLSPEPNVEMTSNPMRSNPMSSNSASGTVVYELKQKQIWKSRTATFMSSLVEVTYTTKMCCNCLMKSDSFAIPKYKLTAYKAAESTTCCCCSDTTLTFLTTDDVPGRPGVKKEHTFKMKGKAEYAKLDTYVYGPLASSGEAIATYSSLINNNLMNPIQLKMDRDSMEGSKSDQPPYEPLCKFGLKGVTNGVTTNAQFRDDAVILDYSSSSCLGCCKSGNHAVIPRFQLMNVTTHSEKCCPFIGGGHTDSCWGEDTVTLEQKNPQPISTPCGPLFLPIYHAMTMAPGTYDKAALLAYIYGESTSSANAQHGASHLINSGLAKKIEVEEDISAFFK